METGRVDSSFAERLKQVVRGYGSTSALAAAIGRSEGAVRNWLTGKSEPTVSNVMAICRVTGTTVEWLMTGEGPRGAQQFLELRDVRGEYLTGTATQAAAKLDEGLLKAISETLEQELSNRRLTLTPAKKAGIVVECYRFLGSFEKFDPATVVRLVELAS